MSANSPVVKRWFRRVLIAVTILVVGLILGVLMFTPPPAETQSAVVVTGNADSAQRAIEVAAARYTAMAEFYLAKDEVNRQRAIEAAAARYSGLAEFYLVDNEDSTQRAFEADAARYTALAAHYAAQTGSLPQGLEADAARYTALAAYYAEQ